MTKILILGGSSEARALAHRMSEFPVEVIYSYAGAVSNPFCVPVSTRIGGFGGVSGLADYIKAQNISLIIDATHPFAAQMSRNACEAASITGVELVAIERKAWTCEGSDNWQMVADMEEAARCLPQKPTRIFLAIGRRQLPCFYAYQQHFFLLRLVNALKERLPFADYETVVDRGPFSREGDARLLNEYRIELIVSKNSGGEAAFGKLHWAHENNVPVVMVARPRLPERFSVETVDELMDWLTRQAYLGV